jgi:ferric-dicitrate binding protein FerR (iron transport regulator)
VIFTPERGRDVKKASEYQVHAEECRRMAAWTANDEHKAALIEMAEAWEALARDRVEHLRRQERIAALEIMPERAGGAVPN